MPAPAPEQVVAQAEPVAVTLDLRRYGVTRGDAAAEELPPLVLPRAMVRLTLLLPTGSEEGEYEVRMVGARGSVSVSAVGEARVRGFVARLDVGLDLSDAGPGSCRLFLRQVGGAWQELAIDLH